MARSPKKGASNGANTLNLVLNSGGATVADREAEAEEVEAIDEMEDGQLFRAMEEVRHVEGAKAEVYRVAPAEKVGHCRSYPVSVFSLERVATDYGAGKYRCKFKGPGDKYIKGGGTFDIAEGLNAGGPAAAGGGAVEQVLALFKAERERDEQDRAKRKGEWLQWATLLAPLVAPKILDMIGGPKGMGPRDLIAMMKDMKEMQAPAADLNTQFQTVLSVLQGAKELVGDDGGKSSTGATFVDLLRDLIQSPAAGALVSAIPGLASPRLASPLSFPSAGPPASPPASVAPPGPAASSASAPSTAPASTSPDMLQQLQWLKATLVQLLAQAHKQSNPRLYGEVVLDNLPPFVDPKGLLERLKADSWFEQLTQVEPHVAQHQEWFQRFRDYAVKALTRRLAKAAETPAPPDTAGAQPLPERNQPMQEEGSQFE